MNIFTNLTQLISSKLFSSTPSTTNLDASYLIPVQLQFKKVHENAKLPAKAHTDIFEDAAFDLFCVGEPSEGSSIRIKANSTAKVRTGLKGIIPAGFWVKLQERSGLALKKGLHIHGGVIDSGYTGEWLVIVYNSTGEDQFLVEGDAVCQFTVEDVLPVDISEISDNDFEEEANKRVRKEAGFGSTSKG